jgi:hypothetical protein
VNSECCQLLSCIAALQKSERPMVQRPQQRLVITPLPDPEPLDEPTPDDEPASGSY